MKLSAIKKLVETCDHGQLRQAEEDLYEGKPLAIAVEGADEGEQLTHILAAIFVVDYMKKNAVDSATALRAYTQRVRESIN